MLVGHSRGGIVISEVAEHYPERVRKLVYIAAYLLPDGESLSRFAALGKESSARQNMVRGADGLSGTMTPEGLREAFYASCSDEDVALAKLCLTPEPLAPMGTPIHVSPANFGRVPRVYIRCLQDRAVPPALQTLMCEASPCEELIALDTDHSPFFSCPELLAEKLAAM